MSYSSAQSSSWQLKIRQRKQRNYIFIEATRRKEEPSSRVRKVTKALSYRCSRNELSEAHLQAAQGWVTQGTKARRGPGEVRTRQDLWETVSPILELKYSPKFGDVVPWQEPNLKDLGVILFGVWEWNREGTAMTLISVATAGFAKSAPPSST